ncbi:ATP-binding protein [Flavobacterium sp. GP15]|uniref:nSTAND3 domain-containing NTPase n=1 Tax=Flavobacterium sp. GP15 TaxID=2758567 RepID=UPI00165EB43A|nr:ATP-binding protein [Flavobacterium sp. GP15]
MSRLQTIENRLAAINETVFQELCDSFLILKINNYRAFSRTGSQSGKQKTTKGTPDTFLLLPNGNYIFVEYSTNISAGLSKLKDDINKCIDSNKTGITINQIDEIILCINFNLTTEKIHALENLLSNTTISLTIYTLDSLALELHLNHRNLTSQYLGLPLDTGQIVPIGRFIEEYNKTSNGIATPLNNTFLHRENELKQLTEEILYSDLIILTGSPGVGKTKLALEGIRNFLSINLSFEAYCVSYKNHELLDDLYQYFNLEKDYILFVDDANRIDAFNQIIGFYKSSRKGNLKIIMTVRDYAFENLRILCQEFQPKHIDLLKFSDEKITDIIKEKPFEILNSNYHKEIVRIADGNPRIAIMTSVLAKEKQDIYALHDVSDLFENYFSTFVKDNGEFTNDLNIKCLGLIAFFHTIPYKNKEITTSILNNFGIDYSIFIDVIDKLDKLELVEIQFEHVKIPEQNLSTYFFYKTFVKQDLLSFETLLKYYFDSYTYCFKDSVIPANNTYGYQNVMQKLQPHLKNHWTLIKSDQNSGFKFLSMFWFYLRNESLEFIYTIIESLPSIRIVKKYEVTYKNNAFAYNKNEVIELLGEFFRSSDNLKDFLEIAFEYTLKKPEHLPELIHKIKARLVFEVEDERYGFTRQNILFRILIDGLNKGIPIYSISFYELSKTFLGHTFQHTKGARNNAISFYDYPIPNVQVIQDLRTDIWKALKNNFKKHPFQSLEVLHHYSGIRIDSSKELMEFDVNYVINIIEIHLSPTSFEHCKYIQDQIREYKRNSISHSSFPSLITKFTNPTYETFLKFDMNIFRDKTINKQLNFREQEKLRETQIRSSFLFQNVTEINIFYKTFTYLKRVAIREYNYNETLDYIIDENCTKDFDLGCQFLNIIIENNNNINYSPRLVFINNLKTTEKVESLWQILQKHEFNQKANWELLFYYFLEVSLIDSNYVEALIKTVSNLKDTQTIYFDDLKKFLKIESNLFEILLKIITIKNEKEETRIQIWSEVFSSSLELLGNDFELIKKAYLQQDKIDNYFDFGKKAFLNILHQDSSFLLEYVNNLYSTKDDYNSLEKHKELEIIWQIENIETVLKSVFDLVIENELYIDISEHFCNSFFNNIKEESRKRAKIFILNYCKENYLDSHKMNAIVDITRHSMRDLFDDILLLFLSLNQNKNVFSQIHWRGNGGVYSGDAIINDIEMAEWKNILSIVEKSDIGIKLIPIKKFISDNIDYCRERGDIERKRRFLKRY